MIRLFIENQEIELDKSVSFAITRQFDDIQNPTTIINDWSKTVQIPFSLNNNKVFGNIYNPDRVIIASSDEFKTGINFDPYKKLDFRLQNGSDVIMSGYAKLDSISKTNGKGVYNITLNGQLGKIFQELKKITFDRSTEDQNYLIEGNDYFTATMGKQLIKDCWDDPTGDNSNTQEPAHYIGFAPCNVTEEDDIDYKLYQNGRQMLKFTDTLGDEFTEATGVEADNVIEKGMSPRGICEFRSYKQIPYIHFNALWDIFKDKAESITGYTFNLDKYFKTGNDGADFSRLQMIAKRFNAKDVVSYNNTYSNIGTDLTYRHSSHIERDCYDPSMEIERGVFITPTNSVENYELYDDGYYVPKKNVVCNVKGMYAQMVAPAAQRITTDTQVKLSEYCLIKMRYFAEYEDGTVVPQSEKTVAIVDENTDWGTWEGDTPLEELYDSVVKTRTQLITSEGDDWSEYITMPELNFIPDRKFRIKCTIQLFYRRTGTHYVYSVFTYETSSGSWGTITMSPLSFNFSKDWSISVTPEYLRSGYRFTINDIWDNENNLFDEILKWSKQYSLVWTVDDVNKTVNIIPRSTYFQNYQIDDWTDKVDMSKEYKITPISFEDKYVLFNYKDNDLGLNKNYKEKFGYNYGEKRLTTNYNFNTDTNELFKDVALGFAHSPNVLTWTSLYSDKKIVYTFHDEDYVYCEDKEGKFVDLFGALMLFQEKKNFDKNFSNRKIYLTDDTDYMVSVNTYCYAQNEDTERIEAIQYPVLSNIFSKSNKSYCNLYGTPKETYTAKSSITSSTKSLYDRHWSSYIAERYNIQNKKLTCYVNLKLLDFCNFEFNHFVKIGNQLYFVNKIYDYSLNDLTTTKVDLITVQDIKGYIENSYEKTVTLNTDYLGYIPGDVETTPQGTGYVCYAYSNYDLTFSNGYKQIVVGGVQFTIEERNNYISGVLYNFVIVRRKVEQYNLDNYTNYSVTVKNLYSNASFSFTRYRDYPNPPEIMSVGTISGGTGTTYIDVRTQYKPLSIEFYNVPTGVTITPTVWEEHNDDYYYWQIVCNTTNISPHGGTASFKVTTGSGYELTGTIAVSGNGTQGVTYPTGTTFTSGVTGIQGRTGIIEM